MPLCSEAMRTQGGCLLVTCQVTPRSQCDRIACTGGKLRVWLHAPPIGGAANKALIELFARLLHVPRVRVTLQHGSTSRHKTVAVEGLSPQEFCRRLGLTVNE